MGRTICNFTSLFVFLGSCKKYFQYPWRKSSQKFSKFNFFKFNRRNCIPHKKQCECPTKDYVITTCHIDNKDIGYLYSLSFHNFLMKFYYLFWMDWSKHVHSRWIFTVKIALHYTFLFWFSTFNINISIMIISSHLSWLFSIVFLKHTMKYVTDGYNLRDIFVNIILQKNNKECLKRNCVCKFKCITLRYAVLIFCPFLLN